MTRTSDPHQESMSSNCIQILAKFFSHYIVLVQSIVRMSTRLLTVVRNGRHIASALISARLNSTQEEFYPRSQDDI